MHIVETYIFSEASQKLKEEVEAELKKEDPKEDAEAGFNFGDLIESYDDDQLKVKKNNAS